MERKIHRKAKGVKTQDGAGVNLTRVLSNSTAKDFDPILMMDSFDSTNPNDYMEGFPMHPHRGIETVTYIAQGNIKHKDSIGNQDTINDGEVQWMITGSGIMHQEFFDPTDRMLGVQLWLNMAKDKKMISPKYVSVKRETIPVIEEQDFTIKVLAGNFKDIKSVQSENILFDFYEITLNNQKEIELKTGKDETIIVFTMENDAVICGDKIDEKTAVVTTKGDSIKIKGGVKQSTLLFIRSIALKEPIAWGGPIVMNTNEELTRAFAELRNGTFLKEKAKTYFPAKQ